MRSRLLSAIWRSALGLTLLQGCAPWCPDSWDAEVDGHETCNPPSEVQEAAQDRVGTGIFGYALSCEEQYDDDTCGCAVEGLLSGTRTVFGLYEIDPETGEETTLSVPVSIEGTFEVQLKPGVTYRLGTGNRMYGEHSSSGANDAVVVAEGEVRFLRISIEVSC